jgi:hypothetical protein
LASTSANGALPRHVHNLELSSRRVVLLTECSALSKNEFLPKKDFLPEKEVPRLRRMSSPEEVVLPEKGFPA